MRKLPEGEKKARAKARVLAYHNANLEQVMAYQSSYRADHKEERRAYDAARYDANRAEDNATSKAWREAHPEKVTAYNAMYRPVWQKSNMAKCNAYTAKYHAAKLQAIPAWADLDAIKDVYLEAEYMQLEVDHMVPLQGKTVCGLHVWDNLQLLTSSQNKSKGHHTWPDM